MYRKKKSTEEYIIITYKVCDYLSEDHFNLLFIGNYERNCTIVVTNLSRLISSQFNKCNKSIVICHRYFKSCSKTSLINSLPSGEEILKEHKLKCNKINLYYIKYQNLINF